MLLGRSLARYDHNGGAKSISDTNHPHMYVERKLSLSHKSGCDVLQVICQCEPQRGVPLFIRHRHVSSSGAYGIHDEGKLIPDGQLKGCLPILSPTWTQTPNKCMELGSSDRGCPSRYPGGQSPLYPKHASLTSINMLSEKLNLSIASVPPAFYLLIFTSCLLKRAYRQAIPLHPAAQHTELLQWLPQPLDKVPP